MMIEIHLVLMFMIAAAVIAVEVKDLVSSVVAIGAVGIGLCMAFLLLKAPDLAIMQLVVEILSLILLVRATIRRDLPFSASGRWVFNTFSTLLFLAVFLVAAGIALKGMHNFGMAELGASKTYLEEGLAKTGASNMVAAITLNYRMLDTLGEAVALFTAVVGILAISRKVANERDI